MAFFSSRLLLQFSSPSCWGEAGQRGGKAMSKGVFDASLLAVAAGNQGNATNYAPDSFPVHPCYK